MKELQGQFTACMHVSMQIIKSALAYMYDLPSGEEKTAKGGKEESGLNARMYNIDSLEIIFDIGRNSTVD